VCDFPSLEMRRRSLQPSLQQYYNFWGSSAWLVAQGVTFDRATCNPAQGVLAQGIFAHYVTCAYFSHRQLSQLSTCR